MVNGYQNIKWYAQCDKRRTFSSLPEQSMAVCFFIDNCRDEVATGDFIPNKAAASKSANKKKNNLIISPSS